MAAVFLSSSNPVTFKGEVDGGSYEKKGTLP